MRGCFGGLIYILIAFPLLCGALTLLAISNWALDRDFYLDIFDNEALYQAISEQEIPSHINQSSSDDEALFLALNEVVPAGYFHEQIVTIINELFDYFDDTSRPVHIYFDLRPIKDNLSGNTGQSFTRVLADNLPACKPDETPVNPNTYLLTCLPSGMTSDQAYQQIIEALPQFREAMPSTLDIANETNFNFKGGSLLNTFRSTIITTSIAALGAWLLSAFIGGGTRRSFILWLSITLLMPASLLLFMGIGQFDMFTDTIRTFPQEIQIKGEVGQSQEVRQALADTIIYALRRISNGFMLVGGIASLISLLLLIIGLSTKPPQPPEINYYQPNKQSPPLIQG